MLSVASLAKACGLSVLDVAFPAGWKTKYSEPKITTVSKNPNRTDLFMYEFYDQVCKGAVRYVIVINV